MAQDISPNGTPALVPPLTCLREGLGQLHQGPVWSGTVQGAAGLLRVSDGPQQGLDVLLPVLGGGARGQSLEQQAGRSAGRGRPQAQLSITKLVLLLGQDPLCVCRVGTSGLSGPVAFWAQPTPSTSPLTCRFPESEYTPAAKSLPTQHRPPTRASAVLEVECEQLIGDVGGQPAELQCRPHLCLCPCHHNPGATRGGR